MIFTVSYSKRNIIFKKQIVQFLPTSSTRLSFLSSIQFWVINPEFWVTNAEFVFFLETLPHESMTKFRLHWTPCSSNVFEMPCWNDGPKTDFWRYFLRTVYPTFVIRWRKLISHLQNRVTQWYDDSLSEPNSIEAGLTISENRCHQKIEASFVCLITLFRIIP